MTSYTYDAADLVESITYPSGRTVDYTRNALGQITAVDTTYAAATTTVADDAAYEPFGPLSSLNFGNSLVMSRTFDQQYRLTAQTTGAVQDLGLTLDAAGNVDAIADGVHASLDQTFTQDPLHRIDSEAGAYGSNDYTYDENGNRLTRVHTSGGVTTQTLTYASDSNRLATHDGLTVSLDAAGNTTADPAESVSFTYDDRNRMVAAYVGAVLKASYVYNGQGQRVKKVEATGAQRTVVYHYGLDGEMLGETIYSSGGAKIGERDYIWLDSLPLAQSERTFSGGTVTSSQFVYLHADQLHTPRLATNGSGAVVWRWDSDAFGVGDANTDPDSDTNVVNVRLRFPGQYLDEETGLAYNYFRDYDPHLGRYVQSDPIGLAGGLNPYLYANGNPLGYIDPAGLDAATVGAVVGCGIGGGIGSTVGGSGGAVGGLICGPGAIACSPVAAAAAASAVGTLGCAAGGAAGYGIGQGVDQLGALIDKLFNPVYSAEKGEVCPTPDTPGDDFVKLKGGQGYRDKDGLLWNKDKLHKDHWDVTDSKGNKVKEIDFGGRQIWPGGPKNKNKGPK